MEKKWAAIITSLTVFPGCGHFIIGSKIRGTIWLLSSVISLCLLLYSFQSSLMEQIRAFEGSQISFFMALNGTWATHKDSFVRLMGIMALVWFLSLVDLLLLIRKK